MKQILLTLWTSTLSGSLRNHMNSYKKSYHMKQMNLNLKKYWIRYKDHQSILKSGLKWMTKRIPVKMLKMFSWSFLPSLTGVINHSLATSFPEEINWQKVCQHSRKIILLTEKFVISYLKKFWKNTFQPNQWLHGTLFFRPPDRLLKKSQHTAMLNEKSEEKC